MADTPHYHVEAAPHIRTPDTTPLIMWSVCAALLPAGAAGAYLFGIDALAVIAVAVCAAIATEACLQKLRGKKITVADGSAALTGLLVAYNLPPQVPLWMPLAGSFFAIAIAKQAFGGLGMNIFNPALAGRAFLMASWPREMTTFNAPFAPDAVTTATPLAALKEGKVHSLAQMGLTNGDLFLGLRGGCIGEVCILALLVGAAYLLWKRYIWWYVPASFILVTGVLSWAFGARGLGSGDFLGSILTGGLVLGAFFMATDYVTCPVSRKGQLIFGACCGALTFVIRRFGGYPEGVCYAILMMNAAVPLIDRWVQPRRYGAIR